MGGKIWTAEEVEKLSPAAQDELFRSGLVTNLDDVPAEFLERSAGDSRNVLPGPTLPALLGEPIAAGCARNVGVLRGSRSPAPH